MDSFVLQQFKGFYTHIHKLLTTTGFLHYDIDFKYTYWRDNLTKYSTTTPQKNAVRVTPKHSTLISDVERVVSKLQTDLASSNVKWRPGVVNSVSVIVHKLTNLADALRKTSDQLSPRSLAVRRSRQMKSVDAMLRQEEEEERYGLDMVEEELRKMDLSSRRSGGARGTTTRPTRRTAPK